jgi:hypothetical protein
MTFERIDSRRAVSQNPHVGKGEIKAKGILGIDHRQRTCNLLGHLPIRGFSKSESKIPTDACDMGIERHDELSR